MKRAGGIALVSAIRVEHAVTGETLLPIEVDVLAPSWFGWSIAYRRGHALFLVDEELLEEQPERTTVAVRLVDPNIRALVRPMYWGPEQDLDTPPCSELSECRIARAAEAGRVVAADDNQTVGVVTLERAGAAGRTEHVVRVDPTATTLEIALVDDLGRPVRGAAVEIRGTGGAPPVALTEVEWNCVNSALPGAGIYRSCPPRVWDARYHPFQVAVDGMRVADRFVNHQTLVTRHRLVTPRTLREIE